MTRSMVARRFRPVMVLLGLIALLGTVLGGAVPLSRTEAAWVDQTAARGAMGSGVWAIDGSARGQVVSATLSNTLLTIPVTVGPIGPLSDSTATPGDRGRNSASLVSGSVPGLGLSGLATASVSASTLATEARYRPTEADAAAQVASLQAGINVLGAVGNLAGLNTLLGNLLTLGSSTGVIRAAVTCPVGSASTAQVTPIADLSVSLLGTAVTLNAAGAATVNVGLPLVATVSATVGITRTVTTSAASADPSAVGALAAKVDLTITPLGGLLGQVKLALDIPIVRATCSSDVP